MNGNRTIFFKLFILIVSLLFVSRLFFLQIYDTSSQQLSANNILHLETVFPSRGIIVDANDKIIVENQPVYDFYIIPNQLIISDTSQFLKTFNLSLDKFHEIINKAKKYSKHKPSIFYSGITHQEFAYMQNQFSNFKGIYHVAKPIRYYPKPQLTHLLGHVGEINSQQLINDSINYYKIGDLIGIGGIEKYYEKSLRGTKGYELKVYDVKGQSVGSYNNALNDSLVSNGKKIKLSIDSDLQIYIEKLLINKVGSVVAIEPSTGNVLAMASSPDFDLNFLTGRDYSKNYLTLQNDSLKPIFNRALMATYPPGSMFKLIQSLIGLQKNLVNYNDKIFIDHSNIGDLAPIGYYDLKQAIIKSSNNYFFKLFRKIINRKTGLLIDPYFSGTKIKWIIENVPKAKKLLKKKQLLFGTIDTFLLWRLTKGKTHATDATNASRTMLYNINTNQWDKQILKSLKIPSHILPLIKNSSDNFGNTHQSITGKSYPITGVVGDQQAATIGQCCFKKGSVNWLNIACVGL